MFYEMIPAAAKQWRDMVAKYANTKAQLKIKKACVRATSVVTTKCLDDAEVQFHLKLLHQQQVFSWNVHSRPGAGKQSSCKTEVQQLVNLCF